ncbi:tail fiber protein [Salinisphaera sp. G21_0]|uniref:phage tail protein n=1 Tax=Salinisphaera sp. G21_0 TaxID=2821094 RepID=UPI001AD99B3E|nr:tail fiber protein [Salinisphaera sp. G21_0]MBO9479974.1 tail fiber protein [Salinisphaera sp. G21_0]
MDFYTGGIISFGGIFSPRDWAFCEGQLLAISQNSALFSLLGTQFGGDGRTNFGLPDLRGRVARGAGHGPGLSPSLSGQLVGSERVLLNTTQIPNHSHDAQFYPTGGGSGQPISATATATVKAHDGEGNADKASGNYWATAKNGLTLAENSFSSTSDKTMAQDAVEVDVTVTGGGGITGGTVTIGNTGGNQPFYIMQPSLGIHYIICLDGLYPPRN